MWPAFPASDYYDSSAPSRRHRPTTGLPTSHAGWRWDRRDGSHVHLKPFHELGAQLCPCGFATATPQAFTVASSAGDIDPPKSSPHVAVRVCTATQPISVRLKLVACS